MCKPIPCLLLPLFLALPLLAQTTGKPSKINERGSIIEDRSARKLLQAGDARIELGENQKALEIWNSVVERYPRSQIRFDAHLRLGDHLLTEIKDFDKARLHFEAATTDSNENDKQRSYAFLNTGICFYEAGKT